MSRRSPVWAACLNHLGAGQSFPLRKDAVGDFRELRARDPWSGWNPRGLDHPLQVGSYPLSMREGLPESECHNG